MSTPKPMLLVAAAALVDVDGRVLICQRPPGKQLAGLWEFPGGKVEPGETPEACLIRELDEELGIKVTHACLAPFVFASHAYESFHLLMPLYLCRRWEGLVEARALRRGAYVSADSSCCTLSRWAWTVGTALPAAALRPASSPWSA